MANADTSFGLRPVSYLSGGAYSGHVRPYFKAAGYATAMFVGDPIVFVNTGNTTPVTDLVGGEFPIGTLQSVEQGAAGGPFGGVVVGFGADPDNLNRSYSPASTEAIVWVADDPNLVFEIQEASGGTALTAAAVGLNASVVVGSGSTTYGTSGVELDNSTEATTATLELKLLGIVNRDDNEIGEHCKWLVKINNHQLNSHTGTAGV